MNLESTTIEVVGWLHNRRDHGKLLFIEIRTNIFDQDCEIFQCICDNESVIRQIQDLNLESVIKINGIVRPRPEGTVNLNVKNGSIEVEVTDIKVISTAEQTPFAINKPIQHPDRALAHRFLYLRTATSMLRKRAEITRFIRNYLADANFTEVQTPILTAPSPEGARDFVIPSRRQKGKFYAMPQSPQLYKQLLMVSGLNRYFQIAPCFRDEDSRSDRLPGEFYQIDLEASFITKDDILHLVDEFILTLFNKFKPEGYKIKSKIMRITYEDSMHVYGTDKPDLRNPLRIMKLSHVFNNDPPQVFAKSIANDGVTLGIVLPDYKKLTPKLFEKCKDLVITNNGPGLVYVIQGEHGLTGSVTKIFTKHHHKHLENILIPGNGLFILSMFPTAGAYKIMGILRDFLGKECDLIQQKQFDFAWITDFPMYEKGNDSGFQFSHNPFSAPQGGIKALNTQEPLSIIADQYDLVCNGYELGSGAIRNASRDCLFKAFEIAGYNQDRVEKEFASLLNAFRFGTPPHGGIGLGLERILMLLMEYTNVRDVCAFPLSQSGEDLMMKSPRVLSNIQLEELHIEVKPIEEQRADSEIVEEFFEHGEPQEAGTKDLDNFFNV